MMLKKSSAVYYGHTRHERVRINGFYRNSDVSYAVRTTRMIPRCSDAKGNSTNSYTAQVPVQCYNYFIIIILRR